MPTYQITDPNTGRKLRLNGDSPPTEQELEQIFNAQQPPAMPEPAEMPTPVEQPPEGQQVAGVPVDQIPVQPEAKEASIPGMGVLETAMTMGSGIVAEPVAGLAGLLTLPFDDAEQAAKNIESVREALTYVPRTKAGMETLKQVATALQPVGEALQKVEKGIGGAAYEATGAPIAGALGEALPTAVMELAGLAGVRRAARLGKARRVKAEKIEVPDELTKIIDDTAPKTKAGSKVGDISSGVEPELKDYDELAKALRKKKEKQLSEKIMPDKEIMEAAEDLGIELNPSAYSTNRAYIDMEQALKSRPGSKLATIEEKSITELGKRADDLIDDLMGRTDKSILDVDIKETFTGSIKELDDKASLAYNAVSEAIAPEVRVNAKAVKKYLDKTLDELGGDPSLLSTAEKKLLALTKGDKPPTYAALDRVRKDVGQGFRTKSGPFKDDAEGNLKQVYKMLSQDQQRIADAFGVGADYQAARRLVASRKDLEKAAQNLLGRELNNSIVPKIGQAATALTKGDTSKFNKLMNALPKARRAEVAATMLNDIFTMGARRKGSIGQGFIGAFEGLNRNTGAKNILFNQLPKGAKERFDKIGKVATGIYRSKALENNSKTARDLISAMEDGGMFGKIYDTGKKIAIVEGAGSLIGAPGMGTAFVIGSALAKKATPAAKAADNLLTSKSFKKAVEIAAKGDPKKAEKILKVSPAFKKWLKTKTPAAQAQISTVGFIPWVTGQTEEKKESE